MTSAQDAPEGERVFGEIAPVYDFLNGLLSLGIDRLWRGRAARALGEVRGKVLDVATGTGDLLIEIESEGGDPPPSLLVGCDPVFPMLLRARAKAGTPLKGRTRYRFVQARAEALPFRHGTFAAVSVAFGLRNFSDRARGLAEMARVLGREGRAVVLDFAVPPGALFRKFYLAYFTKVLPRIGRLVSRSERAYSYLPESVLAWPAPGEIAEEAYRSGFAPHRLELLSGGIAFLLRLEAGEGRLGAGAKGPSVREARAGQEQ